MMFTSASTAGGFAIAASAPSVGIFEPRPFAEIPDADRHCFSEISVMSGVRLARHNLIGMLKKNWGRILYISSLGTRVLTLL
jgi:short-subunit dehydrogenase